MARNRNVRRRSHHEEHRYIFEDANFGFLIPEPPQVPRQNNNAKMPHCNYFLKSFVFLFITTSINITIIHMHSNNTSQYSCERKAIGYHTGLKSHLLTNDQVVLLSHIVFNGIHIENDGRVEIQNDQTRSLLLDLNFKIRALKSNLKVIISTKYESDYLTAVLKNSARRKVWIDFIFRFINEYEVDGLEFSSLVRGTKEEEENYDFISRELNLEFENFQKQTKRAEPYLISLVARNSNSFMDKKSLPTMFFTRNNGTIDGTMAAYVCSDTGLRQILFTNPVVGYPEIGHKSSAFIFLFMKYNFSNMTLFNKFV